MLKTELLRTGYLASNLGQKPALRDKAREIRARSFAKQAQDDSG